MQPLKLLLETVAKRRRTKSDKAKSIAFNLNLWSMLIEKYRNGFVFLKSKVLLSYVNYITDISCDIKSCNNSVVYQTLIAIWKRVPMYVNPQSYNVDLDPYTKQPSCESSPFLPKHLP